MDFIDFVDIIFGDENPNIQNEVFMIQNERRPISHTEQIIDLEQEIKERSDPSYYVNYQTLIKEPNDWLKVPFYHLPNIAIVEELKIQARISNRIIVQSQNNYYLNLLNLYFTLISGKTPQKKYIASACFNIGFLKANLLIQFDGLWYHNPYVERTRRELLFLYRIRGIEFQPEGNNHNDFHRQAAEGLLIHDIITNQYEKCQIIEVRGQKVVDNLNIMTDENNTFLLIPKRVLNYYDLPEDLIAYIYNLSNTSIHQIVLETEEIISFLNFIGIRSSIISFIYNSFHLRNLNLLYEGKYPPTDKLTKYLEYFSSKYHHQIDRIFNPLDLVNLNRINESSPLSNIKRKLISSLITLNGDNYHLIAQEYEIHIPPHYKTNSDSVCDYLADALVDYVKVSKFTHSLPNKNLDRSKNSREPIFLRFGSLEFILTPSFDSPDSLDEELEESSDKQIFKTLNAFIGFKNRKHLLSSASKLRNGGKSFFVPLIRYAKQIINKETSLYNETLDKTLFGIGYGTLKRYTLYEIDELKHFFQVNNDSNLDHVLSQPSLDHHFSDTEVESLVDLLSMYSNNQQMVDLLRIVQNKQEQKSYSQIEERQRVEDFKSFDESAKNLVQTFYLKLFDCAMYMRRWKGPGYPYPLGTQETIRDEIPDAEINQLIQEIDNLLINCLDPIKNFCYETSLYGYKDGTLFNTHKTFAITWNKIKNDQLCIRIASQPLVVSAWYNLQILFNYKINGFQLSHLDPIS